MNIEYKISGLNANIDGAYDFRSETIVWLEKERLSAEMNIYLVKALEEKVLFIDSLIVDYKKELSLLEGNNVVDIEEQIEDYDLAIDTAYDIKSVYKNEVEFEFLNGEDDIDYDLIVLNQKNIDELEKTILVMEKKREDLQRIYYLQNENVPELNDDYNFNKYLSDLSREDVSLEEELKIFDKDFYGDEKYGDYQAWALDELFYEDC